MTATLLLQVNSPGKDSMRALSLYTDPGPRFQAQSVTNVLHSVDSMDSKAIVVWGYCIRIIEYITELQQRYLVILII